MSRNIASAAMTALALIGLAVSGCTEAEDGAAPAVAEPAQRALEGGAPTAEDPAQKVQEEAGLEEHVAQGGHHGTDDGHGAHRHSQGHGGPEVKPGSGMDRHGPGAQGLDRAERRPGEEVRDFALTDNTGKAFRLETLRRSEESSGKIAVLTFWCTTCHSCRGVEREFDEKAREYAGAGVLFLAVASNLTESPQRVNQFLEKEGLSFRVLMDSESEVARYFGAKFTTTTAVIDAEGRLRYYGGFGAAEAAVRNLIAGEEVAVAESPGGG